MVSSPLRKSPVVVIPANAGIQGWPGGGPKSLLTTPAPGFRIKSGMTKNRKLLFFNGLLGRRLI